MGISAGCRVLLLAAAAAACLHDVAAQPFLTAADLPTTPATNANGEVIGSFPATSDFTLQDLNPFLTDDAVAGAIDCSNPDRKLYDVCLNQVALFSGLSEYSRDASGITFLGATDRGPNQGCEDFEDEGVTDTCTETNTDSCNDWGRAWFGLDTDRVNNLQLNQASENLGQGFPVPTFAPGFMTMKADTSTSKLSVTGHCFLWYPDPSDPSKRIRMTGLPNWQSAPYLPNQQDNVPFGGMCTDPQAKDFGSIDPPFYDPAGIDVEDIQPIPGTSNPRLCMLSDEYSPSMAVFNCDMASPACGEIKVRYVPEPLGGPEYFGSFDGYPVRAVLPEAFMKRRVNKGLENVAVSPDGSIAWTMLQSGMGDDASGTVTRQSFMLTAAKLDIRDYMNPTLQGVYLYVADHRAAWGQNPNARSIYSSGFAWASQLVKKSPKLPDNYPLLLVDERANDQTKVYLADFSQATDIRGKYPTTTGGSPDYTYFDSIMTSTTTRQQVVDILEAQGIQPARKALVFDTGVLDGDTANPLIPGWVGTTGKQEGLVALSDCVVAIGDDNDFGLGANSQSRLNVVRVPKCISQLYRELNPPQSIPLRILHVNDVHARIEPSDSNFNLASPSTYGSAYGGLARIAAYVAAARAEADAAGQDILVLHAGDQYQGSPWHTVYTRAGNHGPILEMLNPIGFDVMAVGNHEFDDGPNNLANFAAGFQTPLISCNVDVSRHPTLAGKVKPFVIKTLPVSGKKVALIGMTPPDTATTSSPGPDVSILPLSSALPGCVAAAKAEGAEMIVLVSHIGYSVDQNLAATNTELDLIVGGHSHTFLFGTPAPAGQPQLPGSPNPGLTSSSQESATPGGPYPTNVLNTNNGKTIPVATAYWGSRYIGDMVTTWDLQGNLQQASGRLVLLGGAASLNPVTGDPAIAALVDQYRAPIAELATMVVGRLDTPLVGAADRSIGRNQETNAGNLVCESLTWAARSIPAAAAVLEANPNLPVVCLYNSGGIRSDLPAGDVTMAQVNTILPFGNTLMLVRVTPAALISSLNHGLSGWTGDSTAAGRFPQISGMRLAFDPQASDVNSRLLAARLTTEGTPAVAGLGTDLILLTSNFVAAGGDGYSALASSPKLLDTSLVDAQLLADYFKEFSPVSISTDGRIANCVADTSPLCPAPADFTTVSLVDLPALQSSTGSLTVRGGQGTPMPAARAVDGNRATFSLTQEQDTPWLGVDLGKQYEVRSVTITIAPGGTAGYPNYNANHKFTVRVGNMAPAPNSQNPDSGLDRRPATVCRAAMRGPLRPNGATWPCGSMDGKQFVAATRTGRYLTIELEGKFPSRLAIAEVTMVARES